MMKIISKESHPSTNVVLGCFYEILKSHFFSCVWKKKNEQNGDTVHTAYNHVWQKFAITYGMCHILTTMKQILKVEIERYIPTHTLMSWRGGEMENREEEKKQPVHHSAMHMHTNTR